MARNSFQINFRAWDEDHGKMLTCEEFPLFYEVDNGFHSGKSADNGEWGELPLMQATGLRDKHGKEIYEADVIRITTKRRLHDGHEFVTFNAVIEWQDGGFWFRGINHNQTDCNWHFYNKCDREIVGNIYENPELLTK